MTPEEKIHASIVQYFHNTYCLRHHSPRLIIFQVPNEIANEIANSIKSKLPKTLHAMIQKTIVVIMSKFKAMGLTSGVSDLIVLLPNEARFYEVKNEIGRQSDKQKEFEKIVTDLGFKYYLVRNLEDFKKTL